MEYLIDLFFELFCGFFLWHQKASPIIRKPPYSKTPVYLLVWGRFSYSCFLASEFTNRHMPSGVPTLPRSEGRWPRTRPDPRRLFEQQSPPLRASPSSPFTPVTPCPLTSTVAPFGNSWPPREFSGDSLGLCWKYIFGRIIVNFFGIRTFCWGRILIFWCKENLWFKKKWVELIPILIQTRMINSSDQIKFGGVGMPYGPIPIFTQAVKICEWMFWL